MTTRRKFLSGLGNVTVGSAILGTGTFGAFNAGTEPTSDMRIITPPRVTVKPASVAGRDDEAYVETTDEGYVERIVLDGRGVPDEGVNPAAETRFERLAVITNESSGSSVEEIYFEFEVTDEGLGASDPTPTEIEEALFIATVSGDIPGNGETDFLAASDHDDADDGSLAPDEAVSFGIGAGLLPSSTIQALPDPETFTVSLRLTAELDG